MKLHFFNPSHEEALASGSPLYCPSSAARSFGSDAGALPALWAAAGDVILLADDAPAPPRWAIERGVVFERVGRLPQHTARNVTAVDVWGWDAAVVRLLTRAGLAPSLLPPPRRLDDIRWLSHRQRVTELLPRLHEALPDSVGHSYWCASADRVEALFLRHGPLVCKAPWSGSGRGVFRYDGPGGTAARRVEALVKRQGGVEAEPLYRRRLDFAAEFAATPDGAVRYTGLSVFATTPDGRYAGNLVAPEHVLLARVGQEVGRHVFEAAVAALESCLPPLLSGRYAGPLGVDMMSVETADGPRLHPCVELNLRHTMGSVALSLRPWARGGSPWRFVVAPAGTAAAAGAGAVCLTPGGRRFEAALLPQMS